MPAELALTLKTKEEQEQEEAAAKMQAIQRGKAERAKVELMKELAASPVWAAVGEGAAAKLEEVLSSSDARAIGLADPAKGTALQAAVATAKYECAKLLVGYDAALGAPETELKVWQAVQKDKLPLPEDSEETPKEIESEEYATELAAALLVGMPAADAGYLIKTVIKIGLYFGERLAVAPEDSQFDTQVGAKNGYGVTLSPDGDVYAGMYAADLKEGVGALRTKEGTTYAGEWKGGKRHGLGSMTYKDGGKYVGAWAYGKRHGTGTFTYANGDSYAGQWHAGTKHGEGKYTASAAGCAYEGTWKHGSLVASKVVMSTAAGASYYGQFDKAGRPSGQGAFAFGNGVTLAGSYDAPSIVEAEGDETPVVLPSVWTGADAGSVESTTDATYKTELMTVPKTLNVLIAGAPASGKGTQCEKIVEKYGLVHVSTGDMLRAAAEDPDNEDGQIAKEKMEAGELVPDELITRLLVAKLDSDEVKEKGFLLDGYPRTGAQAAGLETYFLLPNKCILLDVPDEVLVARVTGRRKDPETGMIYHMTTKPPYKLDDDGNPVAAVDEEGNPIEGQFAMDEEVVARLEQRADDTEDALKVRLVTFAQNRDAIAAQFSSIATTVDGNRAPDDVWADVDAFLAA